MKNIYKVLAILITCFAFSPLANAQNQEGSLRDRLAKKQNQSQDQQGIKVPRVSVRAEMKNSQQTKDLSNVTWIRDVYRFIDIEKGINGALKYPVQPIENRMNLYTMIFKLMASGNLVAYDYLDGREVFTEEYKVNFKDVLERLNIPVLQEGQSFSYNDFDIPSNDVVGYYVKEAWYFDNKTSETDVKIVAICPVLALVDDYGIGANRQPQFWIPYENLSPYAARMPIMVSDKNNVMNKTVDDFFRLRLFNGEIYKVGNMSNKVLAEQYQNPEELKAAQEKIEEELKQFEKKLWVTNDSSYVKSDIEKGIKTKKIKKKRDMPQGKSGADVKYSARDRR